MANEYTLNAEVRRQTGTPLKLDVKIANAMLGASAATLDGNEIGSGQIRQLTIPEPSANSSRQSLRVVTVVVDTNSQSDRFRVDYKFTGGPESQQFSGSAVESRDGKTLIFILEATIGS